MHLIERTLLGIVILMHHVSLESCKERVTLRVSTDFFEQSVASASSYIKDIISTSEFKSSLDSLSISASVSASANGGFAGFSAGFSAEASASYSSVKEAVGSASKYVETIKSEKTEFNTGFLQIIRKIETHLDINGKVGVVIIKEFVDTVPIDESLSGPQLRKRADDYMNSRFSGRAVGNKFTETICLDYKPLVHGPFAKTWSDEQCLVAGWGPKSGNVQDCKDSCMRKESCTAIKFSSSDCVHLTCPSPLPFPTHKLRDYVGYSKHIPEKHNYGLTEPLVHGPFKNIWSDDQCLMVGKGPTNGKVQDCKNSCMRKPWCTAINFNPTGDCVHRACPFPLPLPSNRYGTYVGYSVKIPSKKSYGSTEPLVLGPFDKIWTNEQCLMVGKGPTNGNVQDCKDSCMRKPICTAIHFSRSDCVHRACPIPIPQPTGQANLSYGNYVGYSVNGDSVF